MSPPSPSNSERGPSLPRPDVVRSVGRCGSGLKSGLTSIAFWAAVVLPFLHLPLLATGLDDSSVAVAFAVLLVVNVVAVVVGQPHRRE